MPELEIQLTSFRSRGPHIAEMSLFSFREDIDQELKRELEGIEMQEFATTKSAELIPEVIYKRLVISINLTLSDVY